MFNDGYSPHKDMEKNPLDTADDTSCFVVYPGVIFWGCGQVVVLLLGKSCRQVGVLQVGRLPLTL